ncbi:hypothetical protein LSG31_17835 [Fodinisporobacter ferrooxydans]|uniref:Uncharacterized protein n=1 Tax=Fodinisporobacter ferrooxydans TaxID=2901836 RepID=A0ABY4CKE9_9BACL|nr:hypothetical protein LSG31_17835 [Alicyclobacillaceae bacterium MYW30-H2]
MLSLLILLCALYMTYKAARKSSLRFYMFKRILDDWITYAACLSFGGIVSLSLSMPFVLQALASGFASWQLALAPTGIAIGIGEWMYARLNQQMKMIALKK